MTGLANDEGLASFLEHNACPMRSIFSHLCKVSKFTDLVNDAVFIFESTEFTGACNEFSYNLLSLIANDRGDLID